MFGKNPDRADKQKPVKLDGKTVKVKPLSDWLNGQVKQAKKTGK
jgi:hypothetical protein